MRTTHVYYTHLVTLHIAPTSQTDNSGQDVDSTHTCSSFYFAFRVYQSHFPFPLIQCSFAQFRNSARQRTRVDPDLAVCLSHYRLDHLLFTTSYFADARRQPSPDPIHAPARSGPAVVTRSKGKQIQSVDTSPPLDESAVRSSKVTKRPQSGSMSSSHMKSRVYFIRYLHWDNWLMDIQPTVYLRSVTRNALASTVDALRPPVLRDISPRNWRAIRS